MNFGANFYLVQCDVCGLHSWVFDVLALLWGKVHEISYIHLMGKCCKSLFKDNAMKEQMEKYEIEVSCEV